MAFNDEIMVANGDEQHAGSLSIEHKAEASQNYYSPDDATENTLDDTDYIPFYDKSAEAKKNTLLSKIWDYIKNKLGIAESGDTYLKKDGTWGTPVSYSASLTSGTTIGTLTINGTPYTLYCKTGVNFDESLNYNKVLLNTGSWGYADNTTVDFTSNDIADSDMNASVKWGTVDKISSGLSLSSIFYRVAYMTRNLRYLRQFPISNISTSGPTIYLTQQYTSQVPAWTKLCFAKVDPRRSGYYLIRAAFRTNLAGAYWCSIRLQDDNNTPTYNLGAYNDSCTLASTVTNQVCFSFEFVKYLDSSKYYYWWVQTNVANGLEIGTWGWCSFVLLKESAADSGN